MTSALAVTQMCFQDYILGHRDATSVLPMVSANPGISSTTRLEIYHHAYRVRLRDALAESFSKTHAYLGDDLFYAACLSYIDEHPSTFRNLRWFGDRFPEFLKHYFASHQQVAELAQFEWALGLAFDAIDHPVLRLEDIGRVSDWETVGFEVTSSLQRISLEWNSVEVWLALDSEQAPPAPVSTETPVHWIVWRKELQPHFRSLSVAESQALEALSQGESFANVCERAAQVNPDAAEQIAGWLQTWVNESMLSAIVETQVNT